EERIRILDSIPWTHIRGLEIILNQDLQLVTVMKTLLDGMEKAKVERLELDFFRLFTLSASNMSVDELEPLRLPPRSTALKELQLDISLDVHQMVHLVSMLDVSRLQNLLFWTDSINSKEAQLILDSLRDAAELRTLRLLNATITNKQKEQMKQKGITLQTLR
ncbi:hypothetical protein BGX31_006303, partial [Mortierella sp. GBA43]